MGDDKQIRTGKEFGKDVVYYADDNLTQQAGLDRGKPVEYFMYVNAKPGSSEEDHNRQVWDTYIADDEADHSQGTADDKKSIQDGLYAHPLAYDGKWPGIGRDKGKKHDSHAIEAIETTLQKDFKTYGADWKPGDGSPTDLQWATLVHKEIGDWDVAKEFTTTIENYRNILIGDKGSYYSNFLSQQGVAIKSLGISRAYVANANAKTSASVPNVDQPTQTNTPEY